MWRNRTAWIWYRFGWRTGGYGTRYTGFWYCRSDSGIWYELEITQKVISENKNYYYVYIGITKNIDVAKKIKELYEERGYKIKIKEKQLKNEEFSNNVSQFDILLKEATTFDEVLTIEKIILSNYDDLINNPNILE